MLRRLQIFLVVGVVFATFARPVEAELADSAAQGLTIVAPAKVSLTGGDEKGQSTTVTVANAGPAVDKVEFRIVGDHEVAVAGSEPPSIDANSVARFSLTFDPKAGTNGTEGHLVVSASGRSPGTVAFSLSKKEMPEWIEEVIFGALAAALILVIVGWFAMRPRINLGSRMGPVAWDFSKSWASNLTVFSALLGTILASAALPELSGTDKARYAGLNLLFGLGVLVGPFLYTALQAPVKVNRRSATKEPQLQGRVWAFMLATVVTVWAAAGQFATIFHLFDEIRKGGALPDSGAAVFKGLVVVAALSLLLLTWVRMRAILRGQSESRKKTRRETQHRRLKADGVTVPEGALEPELEAWTAY